MREKTYLMRFIHPPTPPHPYYTLFKHHPHILLKGLNQGAYWAKGDDEKKTTTQERTNKIFSLASKLPIPTVVHTRSREAFLLAAQVIPLNRRKKILLDIDYPPALARYHTEVYTSPFFRTILQRILNRRMCITFWTRRSADMLTPLLPRTVQTIILHPPIPPIHKRKKERKPHHIQNLLLVSRALAMKGGEDLLEAFILLKQQFPWLTLTLIGDAPPHLVKRIRTTPGVTYYPALPREELFRRIYPQADLFVYPTLQDIYGYAVLEAYAFGIPVIVYDDFAMREIVTPGRTGIILKGYAEKWYDQRGLKREIHSYEDILKNIPSKERRRVQRELAQSIAELITREEKYASLRRGVEEERIKGKLSYMSWEKKVTHILTTCMEEGEEI